jgi:hypothetical protein
MEQHHWVLFDTDIFRFLGSNSLVELAAQKMCGWEPIGLPFRKLVQPHADWVKGVSLSHGYSRDVLERDGLPLRSVLDAFSNWCGGFPVVAFNLEHHLNQVLRPAIDELRYAPPFSDEGFCLLRLAHRLLDPVPAGSCALNTLRQFYRLPEPTMTGCGADVQTSVDLIGQVLRPILEDSGLDEWASMKSFAQEEWYPTRLMFGKHKGKSFFDASHDPELREWLEWLAESSNTQSAAMGRWYIRALNRPPPPAGPRFTQTDEANATSPFSHKLEVYVDPRVPHLRKLIDAARQRLADLEAEYTSQKCRVSALQAVVFKRLRQYFEERDRLRLVVQYRRTYLQKMLSEGEEAAAHVRDDFQEAETQTKKEYEDIGAEMEAKHQMTDDDEAELKRLWRDLVKLYHPDRYASEPEKQATYTKLTGAINEAKDTGDLETLRKIAADPQAFVIRRGWVPIDLLDNDEPEELQKLLHSLETEVLALIQATASLKLSPSYKLYEATEADVNELDRALDEQIAGISKEIARYQAEAAKLQEEIDELIGEDPVQIGREC